MHTPYATSTHPAHQSHTSLHRVTLKFNVQDKLGVVKFGDSFLDGTDVKQFQGLVEEEDFYRVRFVPVGAEAAVNAPVVSASVKACALATSGFRELMTFHTDVYGQLQSVSYDTPIRVCPDAGVKTKALKKSKVSFRSKGKVSLGRNGERPLNVRSISNVRAEKAKPKPVEKSFWAKYWMYILPLVLFMLFSGGPEPEGGAPKGGK